MTRKRMATFHLLLLFAVCCLTPLVFFFEENYFFFTSKMLEQNINSVYPLQASSGILRHCNGCFQHKFNYLIQNVNLCETRRKQTIQLFIGIFTSPSNIKRRQTIRETWASASRNNTSYFRYAFFLGKPADPDIITQILNEKAKYNDILMEDFVDAYSNLTYKTMMILKYVTNHCQHVKFVFKTDDDMWVNVKGIVKLVTMEKDKLENVIAGRCAPSGFPIRNKHSKWYASIQSYPFSKYPAFCYGTGYLLSAYVAQEIFKESKNVPFFHLEDIYISLCAERVGFKVKNLPGFGEPLRKSNLCIMKSNRVLTSHHLSMQIIKSIWLKFCDIKDIKSGFMMKN